MRQIDKVRYEVTSRVTDLYPSFPIPKFKIVEHSNMFAVMSNGHQEYIFKFDLHFSEAEHKKSCYRAADRMMKWWALNPSKCWEDSNHSELAEWMDNYQSDRGLSIIRKPGNSLRDGIISTELLDARMENE